jgi:hypothetical protein
MMRVLAMLALAALALLPAERTSAQSSQFKGWAAISKELSVRIAPKDEPLDLDEFLPSESMDDLLGTWTTFGSEHRFRNGVPNALNMTIWHVALSGFAKAVGQSCITPRLAFHPRFIATLHKLCAWPAPESRDEHVLLAFWTSIMGYNASEDEYAAWRDFFLREYAKQPASETIAAMTFAITMNPSFLLHR